MDALLFKKGKPLRKACLALGLAVIVEAFVAPSFAAREDARVPERRPQARNPIDLLVRVLHENETGLRPEENVRLAEVILGESRLYRIDPLMVLAIIKTESTFRNRSRSVKGALGLMQILPSTGEAVATELGLDWNGDETLFNPYLNVKMGIHYLSTLLERFDYDPNVSLAAYNIGPTEVAWRLRSGKDTRGVYVERVLANYEEMRLMAAYN